MNSITRTLLTLLIGVAPVLAQTQSFDIATFTAPAGWKAEQRQGYITFTSIDQSGRTFCMLALYTSTTSTGDPGGDFEQEWKNIVQKVFTAPEAPAPSLGRTSSGLSYREGGSTVTQGGNTLYAQLAVFGMGKRTTSVLSVATNHAALDARGAAIRAFLASLRFAAQPAAGTKPPSPRPGGLAGVWMGFTQMYGSYEPSPRWYTFFADGEVFEDLPGEGLAGFSASASKASADLRDYWATYHFEGGSGFIAKPGVNVQTTIQAVTPDRIKLGIDTFYRCASVDGLRLQGAWTSYADPNDPNLDRQPEGARPVFRFSKDGRFADEGVFATFLHMYSNGNEDRAGTGTYEIRDFTLILRYADGRVKQVAFTGLMSADPAVQNESVFISRSRFQARR